ncbi:MAG TPA: serine/threonine-protein kinase [Candidatus Angelobacter sp.]|nr:serine/threonine-protein kinase [Candidatus Angelobacter sp.]
MAQQTARRTRHSFLLLHFCVLELLLGGILQAQQAPFVDVTPPDAPRGCFFPFEDSHGGLWLAGCEIGNEGLFYFDGSRFIAPINGVFPQVVASGMAEDSDGGIWIASTGGVYRIHEGHLDKMVDGDARAGITGIAPDVFLVPVGHARDRPLTDVDLIRISKTERGWKAEAILNRIPQVQFRLDRSGRVLYGCDGGFCALESREVADWRPGLAIGVTHVRAPTRTSYASGMAVVWKDRFGCVWMRGSSDASYQCPDNSRPVTLPENVASIGSPRIMELNDGAIVLPGFGKLALGRPGKFHVLTAMNGYPSAGPAFVAKDGSLWLSNANGLFVVPLRLKMEFWSQRDGLEGNTWSLLRMGNKMFAIAGDTVCVLGQNRSRWRVLARIGAATHLLAGPQQTFFVGSHTDGVVQMTAEGKILRRSDPVNIAMLARTPDGQFWASGAGIFRIIPDGRRLHLEPVQVPDPPAGGTDMKIDKAGDLWACYAGGLMHRDASGWHRISTKGGLAENESGSVAVDPDGNVWNTCSALPAVSIIDKIQNGSDRPPDAPGGETWGTAQAHFLNVDQRGWLWRGGADGVYVADLAQARRGDWLHLGRLDGLPAVDTNQKSFFEDTDGSIWFGVDSSVVHLSPPDDLIHPGAAPTAFLSAFSSDGGAKRMAGLLGDIKSGTSLVAHVGSLQFDRRDLLRLRYRLLPEQSSWAEQRDPNIHLGKLRWGHHRLELQTRLGSGPWSATTAQSILVLTPAWLSWPALSGFALAAGFAVGVGYLRRRKRRDRAKKALPLLTEWRLAALSSEEGELDGVVLDDRFQIGTLLARGGFATVMRGRDLKEDGEACAVKIFHQKWADQEWIERRFRQEVLALEQVRHPNVVSIRGHGTAPTGAPYLVMEFVIGRTLRETLDADRLTWTQVANYLRQIGAALQAIHARGIFHRDLKPDNLMVCEDAPPGREIVLIDFSIAIVKDAEATLQGLSRAAGTFYYMAPEQAMGYADATSDIHSLAKIVVEMLTGKPVAELLPDAALNLPQRVQELLGGGTFGLSPSAIERIGAALEFDPARRPRDVAAFAAIIAGDLESAGGEEPFPKAPTVGLSASRGPFPNDGALGGMSAQ